MAEKRIQADLLQKAAHYDLLAQYYKYSNPNLHIHFYLKHLKHINKVMQNRFNESGRNASTGQNGMIRILHASLDTGNIDVYMNDQQVITDLAFMERSDYFSLPQGTNQLDIFPAGNKTETVLSKQITVVPGTFFTLAVNGKAESVNLLAVTNFPGVPPGESKVRFLHLAEDFPPFDIAVKERDVVFPKVSYQQVTEYLGLTPMTVDLEARSAGTKKVIMLMPNLHFKENGTYTVVLVNLKKEQLAKVILKD